MVGVEKKGLSPDGDARMGTAVRGAVANGRGNPIWASGLKQLYDQVVDEPIPEAFKDLLSKLDDSDR